MKRIFGICLVLIILSGCNRSNDALNDALQLRSELLAATECSFDAEITADYGDIIYTFFLKCKTLENGELNFTVVEPETISGITGSIAQEGGKIIFDDKTLFFEEIAQGEVTPVCAPWLMLKTLKSGYIKGAGKTEKGVLLQLNDSYCEKSLHMNMNLDKNHMPYFAEIFYDGRRIMAIKIEDFIIM